MGASKILGILGICTGWLIPLFGIVLGVIGLCISKEKGQEKRDTVLNTVSIAIAIVFFFFYFIIGLLI